MDQIYIWVAENVFEVTVDYHLRQSILHNWITSCAAHLVRQENACFYRPDGHRLNESELAHLLDRLPLFLAWYRLVYPGPGKLSASPRFHRHVSRWYRLGCPVVEQVAR